MLTSPIIDTAIGIFFVFLLASLLVTALQEIINRIFSLRSKNLRKQLGRVFADSQLGRRVLSHPLVKGGNAEKNISWVDSSKLALAFLDTLNQDASNQDEGSNHTESKRIELLKNAVELTAKIPDAHLRECLKFAIDVEDYEQRFIVLQQWFDQSMQSISDKFRDLQRVITFTLGLIIACTMNIDALYITKTLYTDPIKRTIIADAAQNPTPDDLNIAKGVSSDLSESIKRFTHLNQDLKNITDEVGLPIGWNGKDSLSCYDWLLRVMGWLITAFATTLGAPFWYETLRSAVALRPKRHKT